MYSILNVLVNVFFSLSHPLCCSGDHGRGCVLSPTKIPCGDKKSFIWGLIFPNTGILLISLLPHCLQWFHPLPLTVFLLCCSQTAQRTNGSLICYNENERTLLECKYELKKRREKKNILCWEQVLHKCIKAPLFSWPLLTSNGSLLSGDD